MSDDFRKEFSDMSGEAERTRKNYVVLGPYNSTPPWDGHFADTGVSQRAQSTRDVKGANLFI